MKLEETSLKHTPKRGRSGAVVLSQGGYLTLLLVEEAFSRGGDAGVLYNSTPDSNLCLNNENT